MQMPRYVTGAILFALIWASIVYVNGTMTHLPTLAVMVLIFVVVGSVLSWVLTLIVNWLRNRR